MANRKSRAYRRTLLIGSIVVLLVGGFFLVRWMIPSSTVADTLKQAEQVYEKGREKLESTADPKTGAQASIAHFDEANILNAKAMKDLKEEIEKTRTPTPEQTKKWSNLQGQLLWLKSRILCDTAYAKAQASGEPLEAMDDSITREKFRTVMRIPDATVRNEAVGCLREAAARVRDSVPILLAAHRLEMVQAVPDWTVIERLSRDILKVEPENARARYWLAMFEFEQYQEKDGLVVVTPLRDRSRERVEYARDHLNQLINAPVHPLWRTLYLQAQVNQWLVKDAPSTSKERAKKDAEIMRSQLFDPETGVLKRARKKEAFELLGSPDIEGILGLHNMAVDAGIDVLRVEGNREPLFLALQSLGEVTASLGEIKHGAPFRTRMLESNINAAIRARAALGTEPSDEWSAVRDHLEKLARIIADTSNQIRQEVGSDRLARALVEAGVNRPLAFSALARMLIQEGYLEGKMGNVPAQRELETRALKWIDEGMKLIPPEGIVEEKDEKKSERQKAERERRILEIIDLHAAAIEIQISRGEKEAEIKPHLDALDQLKHPRATAISSVQKAAIEMRAGRFAAARAFLETALKTPRSADLRPRALILLANVYLTTQQSSEAAVVLKELEKIYTKIEKMSPAEAAWIMEFLRDPQELALLSVVADLEIATEKLNRSRAKRSVQQSPVVPITTEEVDIVRADQDAAARSIKRLKAPSDANRLARTMIFNYFLRTGQRGKAEAELKSLKAEYPRSVEVLRAEVTFSILPAPGDKIDADSAKLRVKKTDDLILAFQSENPNDAAVKRFWAEWLIRTSRTEEALAYLENPLNFPGERDEATKRVLAVALLNRGDRDRGQKLLLELPRDASIEALLIRTTANPETRQQLLEKAVIKHESNGQFQVWKGEQLLADGKHLEAADVFWKAREYTRVGDAARMGLLRSLLGLADTDPAKVLDAVAKYSAESKDEAILYSIAAFAALRRDEIGTEADVWPGTKTMWAALNRWRERATKSGLDAPSIALFLSQFWMLANRPDLAFNTLDLSQQRSEAVLNRLIELALASNDETRRARAANFIGLLKEMKPDSAQVRLTEANVRAALGNPKLAIDILEDQLIKTPKYLDLYASLVKILNQQNQTARAAEWTARWRKVAPDDPLPLFESIRQDLVAGRLEKAQNEAEIFLAESAERAEKRLTKSDVPSLEKRRQERLKDLRAYTLISYAQTWQQAGQLDGAEAFVTRALREQPQNMAALLFEAQIALARKDWAKARDLYKSILEKDKENYVAHVNLAWVLAEHFNQSAENMTESLKLVRRVMKEPTNPQDPPKEKPIAVERLSPEFLDTLGKVYREAALQKVEPGLYGKMEKVFRDASRQFPSDPRMQLHLAEAHVGLADRVRATQEYEKALALAREGKGPFSETERREFIQKILDRMKGL